MNDTAPDRAPLPPALLALGQSRLAKLHSALVAQGTPESIAHALPGDGERVLACSNFVTELCTRRPELLLALLDSGDLETSHPEPQAIAERVREGLAGSASVQELMQRARALRLREMLRVAWRDLGGCASLAETVRDASALADGLVCECLARLHEWLTATLGTPVDAGGAPQDLLVLALGKLGAGELNFSSDIDLIFAYPENGETRGARRHVSNEKFFLRLGRQLIKVLNESTEWGHVFRVDMRLRPFGASGPLAMSFGALEEYYQTHGRDWERYALIRARIVAGDLERGDALLERLRPFVYRRYLDFGTLESLRAMKVLITQEVTRKGLEADVKLGPGGIREIEFTGQAFQMVRGGRLPELRDRRILTVIKRLGERDLLPKHAVKGLIDAYHFLRNTEHRLQQVDDRQTHALPTEEFERLRLAAGMGYTDWASYARDLERHRERVSAQFEQVFGINDSDEALPEDDALKMLWEGNTTTEEGAALLTRVGFPSPSEAWPVIQHFREGYDLRTLERHGRERLVRLFPDMLRAIAAQPTPVETMRRVFDVIQSIARRSVYLAMLIERPLALSQLVHLCAASPWISRLIARHPIVLDELLDARTLYAPLEQTALTRDLELRLSAARPGDTEDEMDALRQFKQTNVLRVAAADVSHRLPLMVVSDHLTEIAQANVQAVLNLAWRDVANRYGEPLVGKDRERRPAPFAVIAYGKLGGNELGYASDLDLVFIHGASGANQVTAGPKVVEDSVFFARLCQRIIHLLSTLTPQGVLYEVDPRLRPDGSKGLLVNSLEGLRTYLREKAWTWEHQAVVRARVVAGDSALGKRFKELRREVLLMERAPQALRREVREMRQRMRTELGSSARDGFDLKQDAGGVADIEFMVQYGVLRWASSLGDYLDFTDNIRLLEGFGRTGLIPGADVTLLTDAYRAYRSRIHALALQERSAVVDDAEFAEYRAGVTRLWHKLMDD